MTRVLAIPLFCIAAHAAEVAQFRAEDFGPAWPSTSGRFSLSAVHPAADGWAAASLDGEGVSFRPAGALASPLEFGPSATGAVSRVLVVASCTDPVSLATLVDAPAGASLAPRMFDWDAAFFAGGTSLGSAGISVDGVSGAPLSAGRTPHLVEIAFPQPVPARGLFLGGSPATPVWNRSWPGFVHEALFCFGDMPARDLAALRSYLSLRWTPGARFGETPPGIAFLLRSLGVDSGALYAATLILR